MKNRYLVAVLLLVLGTAAFAQGWEQCKYIKSNGKQCMNNAAPNNMGYCYAHKK